MEKLFSILFFYLGQRPNCNLHKYSRFCVLSVCSILFCVFFYNISPQNNSEIIHQNGIKKTQALRTLILSRNYDNKISVQNISAKSTSQDPFFLQKQVTYVSAALIIFVFGIVMKFLLLPEINFKEDQSMIGLKFHQKVRRTLMQPQFVLALILLISYFYFVSEIFSEDSLADFVKRLKIFVVQLDFYQKLILFTITAIVMGCVLGMTLIPKYVSLTLFLKLSFFLGILLAVTIVFISPCTMITLPGIQELPAVVVLVAILGFVNALFWPVIWSIVFRDFRDL